MEFMQEDEENDEEDTEKEPKRRKEKKHSNAHKLRKTEWEEEPNCNISIKNPGANQTVDDKCDKKESIDEDYGSTDFVGEIITTEEPDADKKNGKTIKKTLDAFGITLSKQPKDTSVSILKHDTGKK